MRFVAAVALIILANANTVYGRELDPKILGTYLRVAFADTGQLVKFARVPSISAYCGNSDCRLLLEELDRILAGALTIKRTDSENSGVDIEILFYPTTNDRLLSKNQYTTGAGEVFSKLLHANCGVVNRDASLK